MTITVYRHHWDLLRPTDGMPLHEQVCWGFAPQPAAESYSERTGLIHRRTESEEVEVETPPFSYFDEGGRFWVSWHKLGGGAKEPDWLPAEMVARMATNESRGFAMAKKKPVGPTLFDSIEDAEPVRKELVPRFSASLARIRNAIREEEAAANLAPRSIATAAPIPVERGAEATDPDERLRILAAAVRRAMGALYIDRKPEARAILEIGLEDAGVDLVGDLE